jgi:hypothetical protein
VPNAAGLLGGVRAWDLPTTTYRGEQS